MIQPINPRPALSSDQVALVRHIVEETFGNGAEIWLFGSRARGDSRGDIDLYVEAPNTSSLPVKLAAKRKLERTLHQRVDLIVRAPDEPSSPIDAIAKETGCRL